MSYYIQDNRKILETRLGEFLFFEKGGDNNLTDWEGKRLSNWSLGGVFQNRKSLEYYLAIQSIDYIPCGVVKLPALASKISSGITDFENAAYKLLDVDPIPIEWEIPLSETNDENILELNAKVLDTLSQNVRGKVDTNLLLWGKEGEPAKRVRDSADFWKKNSTNILGVMPVKEFLDRYKNTNLADAVWDKDFCEAAGVYSRIFDNYNTLLQAPRHAPRQYKREIPFENIKQLLLGEKAGEEEGSPLIRKILDIEHEEEIRVYQYLFGPENIKKVCDLPEVRGMIEAVIDSVPYPSKKEEMESTMELIDKAEDPEPYLTQKNILHSNNPDTVANALLVEMFDLPRLMWAESTNTALPLGLNGMDIYKHDLYALETNGKIPKEEYKLSKSLAFLKALDGLQRKNPTAITESGVDLDQLGKGHLNTRFTFESTSTASYMHDRQRAKNKPAIKRGIEKIVSEYGDVIDQETLKKWGKDFGGRIGKAVNDQLPQKSGAPAPIPNKKAHPQPKSGGMKM